MKKVLLLLFCCLLLILLCACAPSEGQTEPTRLTAPPPAPPTTLSQKEKALEGIGTICDIAKYGDGYLLLTHTGLYTVDKNLENRQFLDDPANKPFVEKESGTLFERLSFEPNYEEPMFYSLFVTSKGIIYGCFPTGSYYIYGEAVERGDYTISKVMEVDGIVYASWRYSPAGSPAHYYITANGHEREYDPYVLNEELFVFKGEPCQIGADGIYALKPDGQTGEKICGPMEQSWKLSCSGGFIYYYQVEVPEREPDYEPENEELISVGFLKRFDGEKIEELVCGELYEFGHTLMRIIVIDDNHILYLGSGSRIGIAEFSAKTNETERGKGQ